MSLLDNVTVTKPLCKLDTDFLIPDFSFETWLQSQNMENLNDIPEDLISKLMKETGLYGFLSSKKCNRSLTPYSPTTDGWRSDCQSEVETPHLSSPISCTVLDICTGFQCCVDVDTLKRSFEVKVQLDICKYQLDIELEKMHVSVPLIDYEYSKFFHVFR
ncbi:uncharacterized protein LOC128556945 [Mercenaria mercenaria]|uniref:uncharacterized protein LOC128556945 n=1 Tax=Mercenaria mercenaria TaxID=6596 RepID=UPI00234F10D8|nr:uncharacterized protein LOC128556945 [Mercenaria mercenaria]